MWQRFPEQAKRIVFYAQEEAVAQGNTDVASEHLLLGVLQEVLTHQGLKIDKSVWPPAPTDRLDPRNAVVSLLRQSGADLDQLRTQTRSHAASLNSRADAAEVRLTLSAKQIIDTMIKEARQAGASEMGAEFLFLALLQDKAGSAGQLLAQFGFDADAVRQKVAILHLPVQEEKPVKPSLLNTFVKRFSAR